ncbi:hypothetical protein ABZ832_17915 [Streptantibioticus parmotrematis]|uniref:hypothetical protein n=1 Tax=Streptantibioticus parmotrematis TaxID=2873249 RepID=UPI0033FB2F75
MRRLPTMAVLAAASASVLTGCVSVSHAPASSSSRSRPPAMPPLPSSMPMLEQQPARETVTTTGLGGPSVAASAPAGADRSHSGGSPDAPGERGGVAAPPAPAAQPAAGAPAREEWHRAPADVRHQRSRGRRHHGGGGGERVAPRAPAGGADVCALGEAYGHWAPDSPAARICHQTYGG